VGRRLESRGMAVATVRRRTFPPDLQWGTRTRTDVLN